jgi:hypothetical protein
MDALAYMSFKPPKSPEKGSENVEESIQCDMVSQKTQNPLEMSLAVYQVDAPSDRSSGIENFTSP